MTNALWTKLCRIAWLVTIWLPLPLKEKKQVHILCHYDELIHFRLEPITRSLHLCCTLESTLSNKELFLEQAFPRKSIVSEDVKIYKSK